MPRGPVGPEVTVITVARLPQEHVQHVGPQPEVPTLWDRLTFCVSEERLDMFDAPQDDTATDMVKEYVRVVGDR